LAHALIPAQGPTPRDPPAGSVRYDFRRVLLPRPSGGVGVRPRRGVLGGALGLLAGLAGPVLGLGARTLGALLLLLPQLLGGDAGLVALTVLVRLVGGLRLQHRGADLLAHGTDGAGVA